MTTVADIFNKIPPFGLVHDWLGQETVEGLLRFAQSNEHCFEDTTLVGKEGEGVLDRTRRVSKFLPSLGVLKSELRGKLEGLLPVMFNRLGNEPFIPSKIEVEFVAHGDGAFFARHTDTVRRADSVHYRRIFSAVYYFNALPKAFSGGELRLHSITASGQQGTFVDITPDRDTLVFFPSFFPHEVLPVKCPTRQFLDSRFAINFWVHRN